MFTAYHIFFGHDFFIYVLITEDSILITAVLLRSLEDIPFGLVSGFDELPSDMYDRLAENTRDLEGILRELKDIKTKKSDHKKYRAESVKEYNKLISAMLRQQEGYKDQKRQIKELIKESGVKIKPGSILSKLLRLDNIPR